MADHVITPVPGESPRWDALMRACEFAEVKLGYTTPLGSFFDVLIGCTDRDNSDEVRRAFIEAVATPTVGRTET